MTSHSTIPQSKPAKIRASTVAVEKLSQLDRQHMWELFEKYYSDVSQELFEADLSQKCHVILLRESSSQKIQGFSTLEIIKTTVQKKPVVAIFSGDTIVEKMYWGQTVLQKAFFRYIVATKMKNLRANVFWFLISKGYKTYLLLARNFPEHWPRHSQATPPWQREVLHVLAESKFGEAWRPEAGILRFPTSHGRLKEGVAAIEPKLLTNPDIRFFQETNPNHALGEELCCLGRINAHLAVSYPLKIAKKFFKRFSMPLAQIAMVYAFFNEYP